MRKKVVKRPTILADTDPNASLAASDKELQNRSYWEDTAEKQYQNLKETKFSSQMGVKPKKNMGKTK